MIRTPALNQAPRWFRLAATGLALAGLCAAQTVVKYTITTIAGTGTSGYSGDGGGAIQAQFASPSSVAVDPTRGVYVADQFNQRIRLIAPAGTISTVIGTGTAGFSGDGGVGTSATLRNPYGVALDSQNNVYVSDSSNNAIRKMPPGGNITSVAGKGSEGAPGYTGDGGPAVDARLNVPVGVAFDSSGNMYIVDSGSQRIRKVDKDGNISTFAGSGVAGFAGDGGPARFAVMRNPQAVAVDSAGNVYIADNANHRIRKIGLDGIMTTVVGNGLQGFGGDYGPAINASLNYPRGIAFDKDDNLYICDTYNSRIRKVTKSGIIFTIAGNGKFAYTGDEGPATDAALYFPSGVAVAADGTVYIADNQNHVIRKLTPAANSSGPPTVTGAASASAFGAIPTAAPGTWIQIYGSDLAGTTREWTGTDFNGSNAPTALEGTTVSIGGQRAYVSYVSPVQVNAQIPLNLSPGAQTITVTTLAGSDSSKSITIDPNKAGLYADPIRFNIGGKQYVGAVFPDGAWVLPRGAIAGINSRPARPGDTILVFGIGFGPVTPATDAGQIASGQTTINGSFNATIGGAPVTLSYKGLSPGSVGLYQFNMVVPNVAVGDAVPLTFSFNGVNGAQTLYTAVGN